MDVPKSNTVDMPACEMCDGADGPAIVRVRLREFDNSTVVVRMCKQCKQDHADEIVKDYKRL